MRKNNRVAAFIVAAFSFMLCFASVAQAQSDPVALLQSVANNMIAGLKKNEATLKTKPQVVYNLAYTYIVPHADVAAMSKQVLPPQTWNAATSSQRSEFEKQFTRTLIRTYASALTSYQDQTVKFYPVRGGYEGNMVEVKGEINSSQGDPIHVTYRMVRSGNSWKLLDMSVEGIGMLDSFRSQFSDILAQGNMAQLLQRLSTHNGNRSHS